MAGALGCLFREEVLRGGPWLRGSLERRPPVGRVNCEEVLGGGPSEVLRALAERKPRTAIILNRT